MTSDYIGAKKHGSPAEEHVPPTIRNGAIRPEYKRLLKLLAKQAVRHYAAPGG